MFWSVYIIHCFPCYRMNTIRPLIFHHSIIIFSRQFSSLVLFSAVLFNSTSAKLFLIAISFRQPICDVFVYGLKLFLYLSICLISVCFIIFICYAMFFITTFYKIFLLKNISVRLKINWSRVISLESDGQFHLKSEIKSFRQTFLSGTCCFVLFRLRLSTPTFFIIAFGKSILRRRIDSENK